MPSHKRETTERIRGTEQSDWLELRDLDRISNGENVNQLFGFAQRRGLGSSFAYHRTTFDDSTISNLAKTMSGEK